MRDTVDRQRRAFWLKHLHQWHWISSAVCLLALVLFAMTGFTLNHAGSIEAKPRVDHRQATLPPALLATLDARQKSAPLPAPVREWIQSQWHVSLNGRDADWSEDEIYLALPRPGGDAWLSIQRESGEVEYELTDRGWVSYFNDLHKGRNTGPVWSWFIDIFALACLIFAITGLFLLKMHAAQRGATWPMVALGLVLPLILILLFIH
ncbi:hypothetical protein FHW69_000368 [Luteibacter sp. Sphag1AF]|uniref:PepSY-associated TM helix domain-containing protein n=1 Tax=Luteibacter sp. Sphag1AF TaxID=2587031 RepID=UPI00161E5B75|nr:PepSY-associated TM helix domain-containing protein [Luteibacter sp. Sphag1AF]MBB3225778.1 hypothetical protein [Luteibacter sp. Sphag1AF]